MASNLSSVPVSASSAARRRLSSAAAAKQPHHLADIKTLLESLEASAAIGDILARLHWLSLLKRLLVDSVEAKDTFRTLKGFQCLLSALHSLAGFYSFSNRSDEEKGHFVEFVRSLLGVLSEALSNHKGNRRFFGQRVKWETLQEGLAATGLPTEAPDQVFGLLLGFAMDDATLSALITSTKKSMTKECEKERWQDGIVGQKSVQYVRSNVAKYFGPKDILLNPEIVPLILAFQVAMPRSADSTKTSVAVLQALLSIAQASEYNLVAMHGTSVLSAILLRLWDHSVPVVERDVLRDLAHFLMEMGINKLQDARELYRKSLSDDDIAEFLLDAIKVSRGPSHIQFDLSIHGYAAIELPSLGRSFPPTSSSGYTFSAWIYVDTFDPSIHTTLLGVLDPSQKCFVLAYIERDSHKFILQTSMSSSRASVRFKSTVFETKRWYHLAVVHRKGRATFAAKASLYVDGEFVEQIKVSYPQSLPNAETKVQAFIGTPSDIAPRVGRGVVSSRWRVGGAHLFEDALSDDLIAVHYRLGPRYHGNFQDCLGSFQTYEASAALNMRNELIHPGREEKSDIIAAIRQRASNILPESKILFNLSATQVLDDRDDNNIDEAMLLKSLSKHAAKNLQTLTRSGAVAVNGAVASINEALTLKHGVAIMTGDPVVVVPQALDDAAWRVGGASAVGLKLVEVAKTASQVCRAVEILFELVKDSWRNSEAMERENGFSVLSHLIRQKEAKDVIGKDLLRLVLAFVGYRHDAPEESFIINPLAYRILLVDFDVWRKADLETQKEYFAQFITFTTGSKYHHFNSKRLVRMRIVKKLLFALKGEEFTHEILPDFLEAFKALIKTNMSADVLRSVSLFITYSLYKHNPRRPLKVKKSNVQLRRQGTLGVGSDHNRKSGTLTPVGVSGDINDKDALSRQLGFMVLDMFHDMLCEDGNGTANLKKFAKTVTNKWLLYLLAEDDPNVVVLATKLLARLLVVHGGSYVSKFAGKSGGFVIVKNRLKKWWNVAPLWSICFAILFGKDVAKIDVNAPLDLYSLLETFADGGKVKVVYPEIIPAISSMLRAGIGTLVADIAEPDRAETKQSVSLGHDLLRPSPQRRRSLSLNDQLSSPKGKVTERKMTELSKMIQSIIQFLAQLQSISQPFRDFCSSSGFLQEMFSILFPVVCSSDHVSAETELNSRDSALTFDGGDVVIRPLASTLAPPIVRTITVDEPPSSPGPGGARSERLRRGSSFILVTQEFGEYGPSTARLSPGPGSGLDVKTTAPTSTNTLVESMTELVIAIFSDTVFERRDFQGFQLNAKIPPGFVEHQIYFETYILRNTLNHIGNDLSFDLKKLVEPKVLMNVGRLAAYMTDCLYEGWFLNGAEPLLNFVGTVLEYLQRAEVSKMKSVRLCAQSVATLRSTLSRIVLFRLSELDDVKADPKHIVDFLGKMMYWQTVFLSPDNTEGEFTRLMCYLLYTRIIDERHEIRRAAADMLRIVLMQKPDETEALLKQTKSISQQQLSTGFSKLTELDNDVWLYWIDDHRKELDAFFYGVLSKHWESFVSEENRKTEDIKRGRIARRKEKLKQWIMDDMNNEDVYSRHTSMSHNWSTNIYNTEHLKFQRASQDLQDNMAFVVSQYGKLETDLNRPCGLLDDGHEVKWRLDLTEGRNRMRKRLLPDRRGHLHNYQPKRRLTGNGGPGPTTTLARPHALSVDCDEISILTAREADSVSQHGQATRDGGEDDLDDDYELVDNPREDDDGWEDKNRKVLRSIQRGDAVESVYNVSRLIGLDAIEGLLIVGKNCLYLMDGFFQRSDGEIVNVWQAPSDERDQYLQLIAGRESQDRKPVTNEHETRNWTFEDLISISKRRFLFRDVGLELFFADGRSYLLTTISVKDRDFLYSKLLSKATNASTDASTLGDIWRVDALKVQDNSSNFGTKLANVFTTGPQNPATKKWVKGEISNFHYLMLINTMAGRTFNDLTQYPVFPWVLADYASEELDLTNPRTFRDFSKPMGAQTPERQKEFRERYRSFEELNDQSSPPFHYGTHFSSAMIVCSYLIRLQPFVQSYLILQGGQFDHADRLFYSIEKAWISASRDNMTDVRELIPEFFFLPEFLLNSNGYNFGMKQGTDEPINNVVLPPWAKGDPNIFVAKHREALESPYVSQHLHEWIDLVFGFKQRGEAAVEATNVFHHLSYHGAIDLDKIEDQVERLAAIGIIHNFGQTPHQVFTRGHAQKEKNPASAIRLDVGAETLIRLPFPLLDSHERVVSLMYSSKYEKVFCAGAFRLNIPPLYDKHMEWGFVDSSVRFYQSDSRKLIGHHEHLHPGQLSCAKFADARTLATAGTDGTVSVWHLNTSSKSVDLQCKATLFGHVEPVMAMAVSRSFSTLVTASNDKTVIVWDLNRMRFIRKLPIAAPVQSTAMNDITGDILLCTGPQATLYTINGQLVLTQDLCETPDDNIISCAFYEGTGNEWLERELVITGHKRGIANIWEKKIAGSGFVLEKVKELQHVNQFRSEVLVQAAITEVLPMSQAVYTGDDTGRVYEWDCQMVQRSRSPLSKR